jgi:quaternary ammonium compound-resistance protein SugE
MGSNGTENSAKAFSFLQIPMGTACAVWTGIGTAGAFFTGILLYGDPASLVRFLGVALIVGGVVVLKLAH